MRRTLKTVTFAAILLLAVRSGRAQVGATAEPVLILKAPNLNRSVCFSPDGKRLLTVREDWGDKKVCIFSLPEGQLEREFGHTGSNILCAAFSPDAKFVVYGSADNRVRVADAATGAMVNEMDARAAVRSVAWTSDGKSIVAANEGNKLLVWDAATFRPRFDAPSHKDAVSGMAVSPDGHFAASCTEEGVVIVTDLQRGMLVSTLEIEDMNFRGLAFSGDGAFLAGGGEEKPLRLWRVPEFAPMTEFTGPESQDFKVIAVSPDGRLAATANGADIVLWDVGGGRSLHKRHAGSEVSALAFSPDGKYLAAGTNNRGVQLYGLSGVGPAAPRPAGPKIAASGRSAPPAVPVGKKVALAVVDFELRGKLRVSEPDAGRTISSLILSRIEPVRFEIYERGQLLALLEEQKLQMSELADNTDKAIRFGKIKGIRLIVVGSVDQLGQTFFITARLVDCETGLVGVKADAMANDLNLLGPAIDELLAKMGLGG